jgi:hypothetical protein
LSHECGVIELMKRKIKSLGKYKANHIPPYTLTP